MKFAHKLFFSVIALLTVIFLLFGTFMLSSYFDRMLERETEQGKRENLLFQTIYDMVYQNMEKYGAEFAGIQAGNSATERMTGQSGTECMILETDGTITLEGSLKLKEISYVHSDAYAAGELKHGTISLVTDGVPVIALATQKQVYEKTISNAKETKSRGAKVLLFTTQDAVVPDGVADYVVRLDDYDDLLMPLQLIVPLQLFAYYMAVLRGCDVDKPRNLAKSVTVE